MKAPAVDKPEGRSPLGLKWRSSYWFTTFVVGLGIAVDLVVYSIIIPVMPFHLEKLGYHDISSLTGWLLFAYSGGLVMSTIPIAMLSERYQARRMPLLVGLVILIGSQIMLMEIPIYAVMCISRVLQGVGSSMVWVVGLALLCDSSPENLVGRQLGIAMAGLSLGVVIGPPVGGALYSQFGYRGPFIFGLAATTLDLVGRLVIIERKEALLWGWDPAALSLVEGEVDERKVAHGDVHKDKHLECLHDDSESQPNLEVDQVAISNAKPLSLLKVIARLSRSRRALVAFIITLVYGIVYSSQEPSIPLHLQRMWGLDSGKVGLVFIAAVIPTFFSSPLSGYYSDKKGTGLVIVLCLALSLPWWVVVCIDGPLALFIVAFALESFFTSGIISPLTAELAAVARDIEGIGYAHVYGALNVAYGAGNAVGPIVGGQIYDHLTHGWTALCLLATGLLAASIIPTFCFIGSDPLLEKMKTRLRRRGPTPSDSET